jgi:hypothetical protein
VLERLREALKLVAGALKETDVPFALAGGNAAWARGAPESGHDVDFLIRPEDREKVATQLERRGFEVLRPAEDWLFKVQVDGVTVDVLLRCANDELADLLERATVQPVLSVRMPVLTATDVVVEKLAALDEHYCDFAQVLPVVRALREQVDWEGVRSRVEGNPFAEALLHLLERLDVITATPPGTPT